VGNESLKIEGISGRHLLFGIVIANIVYEFSFEQNEKLLGVMIHESARTCRSIFDDKRVELSAQLTVGEREVTDSVFFSLVAVQLFTVIEASE
jgi:hypothetical protein